MRKIREIRDGICKIYGMERIIPRPYNIFVHGILEDIKIRMLKNFWGKKK